MKTVAEIHAELAAAKIVAMNNFERDWGTRDVPLIDWDRPVAGWIALPAIAVFIAVLMLVVA